MWDDYTKISEKLQLQTRPEMDLQEYEEDLPRDAEFETTLQGIDALRVQMKDYYREFKHDSMILRGVALIIICDENAWDCITGSWTFTLTFTYSTWRQRKTWKHSLYDMRILLVVEKL